MTRLFLQGSGVCAWEALWELAKRRPRLGYFQEPLLGHSYPALGQRWFPGGQDKKKCYKWVLGSLKLQLIYLFADQVSSYIYMFRLFKPELVTQKLLHSHPGIIIIIIVY